MSYTPGPWHLDFDTISTALERKGELIAMVMVPKDGNFRFNARLISAAPDLLEACKKLLEWANMDHGIDVAWPAHLREAVDASKNALAKAEGK